MASDQWTSDWDARFASGDTPWEESEPPAALRRLVVTYAHKDFRILEIGCGLGANVRWLLEHGYDAYGADISREAIARAAGHIPEARLSVMDITALTENAERPFDIVIERGVLHTFSNAMGRKRFMQGAAHLLNDNGHLLSIAGSFDEETPSEDIQSLGLPRLRASDILLAAEDRFALVEMTACDYGNETEATRFRAWSTVLRKRRLP